ncbi:MAG: lysylphosphatidylglycerol synthase transmembrane domain-containing protein [Proteobacteria bacterium]|nr:lysylphosphatidylglycerol synthase transmembrane domain-containing protein [Pseudomonadota bacterium]
MSSIIASAILLGLVVAQVDWHAARALVVTINYRWIAVGVSLLVAEGLVTAARFRVLARTPADYLDCLQATAWYVLMLVGLPARLGEIAGIGLIVRYMDQSAGAALASLLFQRVFDMILLVLLLAVVFGVAFADVSTLPVIALTLVTLAILVASLIFLADLLTIAAGPLLSRRHDKRFRRLLRAVLQARMVRRHYMDRQLTLKLGAYTVLKWLTNLAAIACVVAAVVPALSAVKGLGIGIVYNLSAVIPIQTIGGFGISEAALLGSFSWLGYSLAQGAPIVIAVRLALISAPILFWLGVTAATIFWLPRSVDTAQL